MNRLDRLDRLELDISSLEAGNEPKHQYPTIIATYKDALRSMRSSISLSDMQEPELRRIGTLEERLSKLEGKR